MINRLPIFLRKNSVKFAAMLLLAACILAQAPLADTTDQKTEPKLEPRVSLDVEALLHDQTVLEDQAHDMVWTIAPQPDRRLVQIPVIVEPLEQTSQLGRSPIRIRGARFICWRIIEDDQQENAGRKRSNKRTTRAGDSRYIGRAPTRGGPGFDMGRPNSRQSTPGNLDRTLNTLEQMTNQIPDDAPRFARKISIEPDGTIRWKIERSIPGGEINPQATEGYALKLDNQLLAELYPKRNGQNSRSKKQVTKRPRTMKRNATPPSGGSTKKNKTKAKAAEDRAKRQAEDLEFRAQIKEYRELTKHVRGLPDEFQIKMPARLWAVYEVSQAIAELNMTGPKPLPWRIRFDDFVVMRDTAGKRAGGRGQLDLKSYEIVAQLRDMVLSKHPLTLRMVAMTLDSAGMVGQAQQHDSLYRLLEMIINDQDRDARGVVITSLATTIPPTIATAQLLRGAAAHMDPMQKLEALRGLFQIDLGNQEGVRQMIATANQALADPTGSDAGDVLAEIVKRTGDNSGRGRGDDTISTLTTGIDFQTLSPQRADQAIAYIIRAAGTEPLAASWLNHRLLGSPDRQMLGRTLELINAAAGKSPFVQPTSTALLNLVFGAPQAKPSAIAALDLELSGLIPIDTTHHNLYRCLSNGDLQLRSHAWDALVNFQIDDSSQQASSRRTTARSSRRRGRRQNQTEEAREPDRYDLILNAAFLMDKTPWSLPVFLAKQTDQERAGKALIAVILRGDEAASASAARKLHGCGWNLESMLQTLDYQQRGLFGVKVYQSLAGQAPLVTGLLRQAARRNQSMRWFAQQMSDGHLPEPIEWAKNFPREEDLLEIAGSADDALAAGAVAALVSLAGGDEPTSKRLAESFRHAPDRTMQGLRKHWRPAKKQIYTTRLAAAAGSYRLKVIVGPPSEDARNRRQQNQQLAAAPGRTYPGGGPGFGPPPGGRPGVAARPGGRPVAPAAAPAPEIQQQPIDDTVLKQTVKITLGVVDLIVDTQAIRFEGETVDLIVPDEHLAIRIKRASSLKGFDNKELEKIPLDRVREPLDLIPHPDGSWQGEVFLPDGRVVRLLMEPVKAT
jgi:hypothetical protein